MQRNTAASAALAASQVSAARSVSATVVQQAQAQQGLLARQRQSLDLARATSTAQERRSRESFAFGLERTTTPSFNLERAGGAGAGGLVTGAAAAAAASALTTRAALAGAAPTRATERAAAAETMRPAPTSARTFALPQTGERHNLELADDPRRMLHGLNLQATGAGMDAEVAKRQAEFLRTREGKEAAQDVLGMQARQRRREAELRLSLARVPKGRSAAVAERSAFSMETNAQEREQLELIKSREREALAVRNRLLTKRGAAAFQRTGRAAFELETREAQVRSARADAARGLIGGAAHRGAVTSGIQASVKEENNALRSNIVLAQQRARFLATPEGRKAAQEQVRLAKELAAAQRTQRWRELVAEQGKFGGALAYANERLTAVRESLGAVASAAGIAFAGATAAIGGMAAAAPRRSISRRSPRASSCWPRPLGKSSCRTSIRRRCGFSRRRGGWRASTRARSAVRHAGPCTAWLCWALSPCCRG